MEMAAKHSWLGNVLACSSFFTSQTNIHTGKTGRTNSVFLSFLALNDVFSFVPMTVSHIRWHLHTAPQNLEMIKSV